MPCASSQSVRLLRERATYKLATHLPVNPDTRRRTATVRIIPMKSVMAVGIGMLLALAIGLLVVQGILAPVFTHLFRPRAQRPRHPTPGTARLRLGLLLLLRRNGRQLQSPLQTPPARGNGGPRRLRPRLGAKPRPGKGTLSRRKGTSTLLLVLVFLLASLAASYVGSKRGARNLRPQPASRTTPTEEVSISAFQPVSISGLSLAIVGRLSLPGREYGSRMDAAANALAEMLTYADERRPQAGACGAKRPASGPARLP